MATRRDFLKQAFLLAGASGVSGVVPEAVQRAFAIAPDPGTSYLDAEHIVILMQENRSFDHVFGTLQGVRGFNDPRAIRQADGSPVFLQRSSAGETYAPWRLDIKDTRITWMGSIPHSRESQVDAWNGGHHNHWIESKRSQNKEYRHTPMTMGHYTREDLPFYYALADAFTVCDQHYCGVMTSTTPNRLVFWTGTVRDRQSADSIVYMRNPEIGRGGMSWTTYPERLHQAGISWKFYQNELSAAGGLSAEERAWLSNFGCNVLEFFSNYNVRLSPTHRELLEERIKSLDHEIDLLKAGAAGQKKNQARLQAALKERDRLEQERKLAEGLVADLSKEAQELYARAFVTNLQDPHFRMLEPVSLEIDGVSQQIDAPKGDLFHQFRSDVRSGKLPTVSWLAAPEKFSDHPTSPWYGAWYVSEVMNILTENPEVWKKTIFILTYDENDGYFDHAPSFVAADPLRRETGRASEGIDTALEYTYVKDELVHDVPESEARSGPIGLGFRVPMIVASPWSRGGWVNSELCDHSSTIQFLEKFIEGKYGKKVEEPNISAWRRTISGDLTSNFRTYQGEPTKLPFLKRNTQLQLIENARNKQMPTGFRALQASEVKELIESPERLRSMLWQEPGTRPACSLPYELYAEGDLDREKQTLRLRMKAGNAFFGKRSAGSPFNVYLYGTKTSSAAYENEGAAKMMAATYVVRAGDELEEPVELSRFVLGNYDVAIHGPNGFFRHLSGNAKDPAVSVTCGYSQRKGDLEIHLKNDGAEDYEVWAADRSYGQAKITRSLRAGQKVMLPIHLGKSSQWYDVEVTVKGHPGFIRRYAGHVETGSPSLTDPAMGLVSA